MIKNYKNKNYFRIKNKNKNITRKIIIKIIHMLPLKCQYLKNFLTKLVYFLHKKGNQK